MTQWARSDIEAKVRRLLGFNYDGSLSQADVVDQINKYYVYTFPIEVKPRELKTWWDTVTTIGTDSIDLPTTYTAFIGPYYWAGVEIRAYFSPDQFFQRYPQDATYVNGKVNSVLLYDNKLLMRSPPDAEETLRVGALLRPEELDEETSEPLRNEWGLLISYGAAEQMAYEFGDDRRLQFIQAGKMQALSQAEDQTYTQLSYTTTLAKGY